MSVDVRQEPDHDPYPYEYRESGRRWPFVLLAVALAFLVAAGSAVLWVEHQVNPPGALGPSVHVTIPRGASTAGAKRWTPRATSPATPRSTYTARPAQPVPA